MVPVKAAEPIDKSTWGVGPWQMEPDRVDFVHAGFACLALRNPRFGNWCGYVGIPKEHPSYGADYGSVDVDVHGGLTYGDRCNEVICHVPQPGCPDELWWFGFDCLHFQDYGPAKAVREKKAFGWVSPSWDVYRDLAYVRSEIESLAEQLRQLQAVEPTAGHPRPSHP